MLALRHPSCRWGYQDHVTMLAAAKTRVGLLICGEGYFTVRHSVLQYVILTL
jgi:hypothetical protein